MREQVRRKVSNWALEEEARGLRQGAQRHRRIEAMVCRNPERKAAMLVEESKRSSPATKRLSLAW
jgi:hypothetical protein